MASFEAKSKAGGGATATTTATATATNIEVNASPAALVEFYKDLRKLPQTRLIVRSKDAIRRIEGPVLSSQLAADGAPDTVNVRFLDDASFDSDVTRTDSSLHVRYESMTTYSPSGDLFVKSYCLVNQDKRAVSKHLVLCRSSDGHVVVNIPVEDADDARFSNTGSLLVTWSRARSGNHKYQLWRINRSLNAASSVIESVTIEEISSFPRKIFAPDIMQFSCDDSFIFVQMTNEIQIFRTACLGKEVDSSSGGGSVGGDAATTTAATTTSATSRQVVAKIRVENLASFKVSPVTKTETSKSGAPLTSVAVAVFVPEIKGSVAQTTIHKVTLGASSSESSSQVVNARSMFNASDGKFMWSASGATLLFQASSDVDKSGSSYYGSSTLFILANADAPGTSPLSMMVPLTKEGPIHDAKWSPCDEKFVVVAGSMPPQCTMYNDKAQATYQFGSLNRNTISFSPHGRFMVLAGFGNLAGEMDFYDINVKRVKKIGSNTSHCTVMFMWSPDSRNFVTAAVAPRMNVDNEFKVFKYNGTLTQRRAYPDLILEVRWEQLSKDAFPDRGASPKRAGVLEATLPSSTSSSSSSSAAASSDKSGASKAAAPVGAYRPPGSSGSLDWTKRDTGPTGKVPSAEKYKLPARVVPGAPVTTETKPSSKQAGKEAVVAEAPVLSKAVLAAMGKLDNSNNSNSNSNSKTSTAKKEAPAPPAPVPTPAAPEVLTAEEKEKRVRNLKKKLKQVQDLKVLERSALNPDQLSKLATESSLIEEISKLEA